MSSGVVWEGGRWGEEGVACYGMSDSIRDKLSRLNLICGICSAFAPQ